MMVSGCRQGHRRGGHSKSTQDGATNDETLPATQMPPTGEAAVTRPGTGGPHHKPAGAQRLMDKRNRKSYSSAIQEWLPDTVVIGTSLVIGVGKRLRERGIDNITYCFPGAHLPQIRNRLNKIIVPGKIPKNIVVQAGGNDIEHHRTDLVVKEYGTLIKALKSQCPKSNIVLCKIPCRSPFQWLHEEIAKVNTFLANSTHGGNVHFIDLGPEFGPRYFRKDMVHFNHEGIQVYGDKVACSLINFQVNLPRRYH